MSEKWVMDVIFELKLWKRKYKDFPQSFLRIFKYSNPTKKIIHWLLTSDKYIRNTYDYKIKHTNTDKFTLYILHIGTYPTYHENTYFYDFQWAAKSSIEVVSWEKVLYKHIDTSPVNFRSIGPTSSTFQKKMVLF